MPTAAKPRAKSAVPILSEPLATPVVMPWPPKSARVRAIFKRFEAAQAQPRTELNFHDPFTLVVAVALSAQATDKSVNKATERLFAVADTPAAMAALGEAGLIPFIASIGLYRTKAKNVIALSRLVLEKHGGHVPLNRADLQALPGVGRKTASVVLNELGIEPAIAVDTHVFRVSHRLGLADASTPDKVEQQLLTVTPKPWRTRAHHWLILHGRYVCVALRPKCEACLISDLCPSAPAFLAAFRAKPGRLRKPPPEIEAKGELGEG